MRLPARIVLVALITAGCLALAGCGQSPTDAVRSVRSEVSGAVSRTRASVRGDIDRAQARVDDLVARAHDGDGTGLGRIHAEAERILRRARVQSDRAIARAKRDGADPGEIADLRAEAAKRLRALRRRIDAALIGDL